MKYAVKVNDLYQDCVAFTKENWFEVAVLCCFLGAVFWAAVAIFSW